MSRGAAAPAAAAVGWRPRVHALRWWAAVAVALLAGYADLARGGVVLAPLLLALAYGVLAPVALLRR